jgi:hypothetical protein
MLFLKYFTFYNDWLGDINFYIAYVAVTILIKHEELIFNLKNGSLYKHDCYFCRKVGILLQTIMNGRIVLGVNGLEKSCMLRLYLIFTSKFIHPHD